MQSIRNSSRAIPPLVLLALLLACSRSSPLEPREEQLPLLDASGANTSRTDPAEILSAAVMGDRLRVEVRYGGGCKEHHFSLLQPGAFRESSPAQIDLALAHDAQDDPCRAQVGRILVFDLSPLKQLYEDSYGEAHGMIELYLYAPGATQPVQPPLRYEF